MSKREGLSILTNIHALDKLDHILKTIGGTQPTTTDNYKLYHDAIADKLKVSKSNIVVNITKMSKEEGRKITLINLINLNTFCS